MKKYLLLLVLHSSLILWSQNSITGSEKRVVSVIDSSRSPELVLIQSFAVNAAIDKVWDAYTTKEGWENWAVPLAEVDLKVGGYIKSNYNKSGQISDSTTIITHIINYVPERLLTLQAEITDNFPEFMKDEAHDFYNVIYFNETSKGSTRVESYGIGYKNRPKYIELMNYFISANEQLLLRLIKYLEESKN